MFSPITKPNSGEEPPAFSVSVLPNDLLIEILTRLPGKQIGRCKCVCKPWRAMVGSRPFTEIYRKRQRGLLLYWADEINRDGVPVRRIRFFHCPLRRLEEPREEFSALRELEFSPFPQLESELETGHGHRFLLGATQLVNGLLCVGEGEFSDYFSVNNLTIHNICTGDMMRIPNPLPCVDTYSAFHLGYDPASKMYKLLRLIFSRKDARLIQGGHIMTLMPPSRSLSTWRELDYSACDLRLVGTSCLFDVIASPDDGILCWTRTSLKQCLLLCFDLNTERFQLIDYPEQKMKFGAVTRFKDNLALWLSDRKDYLSGISCYVLENNDEGKNWSDGRKHLVEILKEFKKSGGFQSGNRLSFATSGELLVRNPDQSWLVYPYSRQHTEQRDKDAVFIVGKLPDGAPDLHMFSLSHCWERCFKGPFGFGLSCFMEGNNIFLPLDHVLGGGTGIL